MGQLGFFDHDKRLAALSEKGDPLEDLGATITGPTADLNLGIQLYADRAPTDAVQIDTTKLGTHSIDYVATDPSGRVGTASRVVNVVAANDNQATTTPPRRHRQRGRHNSRLIHRPIAPRAPPAASNIRDAHRVQSACTNHPKSVVSRLQFPCTLPPRSAAAQRRYFPSLG